MGKTPVILSADAETKEVFRRMIAETADAIIRSYDDNTAYSGKDVYKLREDLNNLGFLPEKGTGFEETLSTVEKDIMPHLLAFAAGAMIYVVVEELIPESQSGMHSNVATIGVAVGFALMMVLDVALG